VLAACCEPTSKPFIQSVISLILLGQPCSSFCSDVSTITRSTTTTVVVLLLPLVLVLVLLMLFCFVPAFLCECIPWRETCVRSRPFVEPGPSASGTPKKSTACICSAPRGRTTAATQGSSSWTRWQCPWGGLAPIGNNAIDNVGRPGVLTHTRDPSDAASVGTKLFDFLTEVVVPVSIVALGVFCSVVALYATFKPESAVAASPAPAPAPAPA